MNVPLRIVEIVQILLIVTTFKAPITVLVGRDSRMKILKFPELSV